MTTRDQMLLDCAGLPVLHLVMLSVSLRLLVVFLLEPAHVIKEFEVRPLELPKRGGECSQDVRKIIFLRQLSLRLGLTWSDIRQAEQFCIYIYIWLMHSKIQLA